MFPLCRTCADTMQQESCHNTDADRAMHGTWVMARNYEHARFAHVSDFSDNGGPMAYVYS